MRVLVIEDDPEIGTFIRRGLSDCGHAVTVAGNGSSAIAACGEQAFDAVVLDRLLPDTNGLVLIEGLRKAMASPTPVVMLSALGSVEDRIDGLDAGADDYLTKPFSLAELDARLAAVRRRVQSQGQDQAHAARSRSWAAPVLGRLVLDCAGHSVRFGEKSAALNRKEYSVLAFLICHADQLVTRSMLLENVWNYSFEPTTNIVESNLSRLRARLAGLGVDPIETRRGAGYILRSDCCV